LFLIIFSTSPLHEATKNGNVDIVNFLIDCNADINKLSRTKCFLAPIHLAASLANPVILDIFLQKNADVNIKDFNY